MRTCAVDGCGRPHHANGYCGMHEQRRRRTGNPVAVLRTPTLTSFWNRVVRSEGASGCWIWTGYIGANGYGSIATRRSPVPSGTKLAHRVSWELAKGPIPEGLHLDHLCRVRHCVNPDHLDPVEIAENVRRGLHGVLRTHCKYGHELTTENTQYDARRNCRRCRTCAREWNRRATAKKQASVRSMYSVAGRQ